MIGLFPFSAVYIGGGILLLVLIIVLLVLFLR